MSPPGQPSCAWDGLPTELKLSVLEHNVVFPTELTVMARYWNDSTELRSHNRVRHEGTALKFTIGLEVPVPTVLTGGIGSMQSHLAPDFKEIPEGVSTVLEPRLVSKVFYTLITQSFYSKNSFHVSDCYFDTGGDYGSEEGKFPMTSRFIGYLARHTAADGHKRYYDSDSRPLGMIKALRLNKKSTYLPHQARQWQMTLDLVFYHCTLTKLVISGLSRKIYNPSTMKGMAELVRYVVKRENSDATFELSIPENFELEGWIKKRATAHIAPSPQEPPAEPQLPRRTFVSCHALVDDPEPNPVEVPEYTTTDRRHYLLEYNAIVEGEIALFRTCQQNGDVSHTGYDTRRSDWSRLYVNGVTDEMWETDHVPEDGFDTVEDLHDLYERSESLLRREDRERGRVTYPEPWWS